ncbi:hypothetical protein ACIBH1_27940 [Nonomuraea sp. NPDC050663]|uniref:hypothetical protein n=1 Tax=Nonomuraea sp. NPDC050663 TaxID=3364370 RepID=UPI0037B32377
MSNTPTGSRSPSRSRSTSRSPSQSRGTSPSPPPTPGRDIEGLYNDDVDPIQTDDQDQQVITKRDDSPHDSQAEDNLDEDNDDNEENDENDENDDEEDDGDDDSVASDTAEQMIAADTRQELPYTRADVRNFLVNDMKFTSAADPFEIMDAISKFDNPGHPLVWQAVSDVLKVTAGGWAGTLAAATLNCARAADIDLHDRVKTFCDQNGLDYAEFVAALKDEGHPLFGKPNKAPRNLFEAGWRDMDPKVAGLVKTQLGARHKSMRAAINQNQPPPTSLTTSGSPEQHSLDRLAWVLATLRSQRQCVAVAKLKTHELRLFANKPDDRMEADFRRLLQAADEQLTGVQEMTQSLLDDMTKKPLRGMTQEKTDQTSLRRLTKTLKYLTQLSQDWADLRVMAHTAQNQHGHKSDHVHAETQAGALVVKRRMNLKQNTATKPVVQQPQQLDADLAQLNGAAAQTQQMVAAAQVTRDVQEAEFAIGISKLCCFYCWLMLSAVAETEGLDVTVSSTHFDTYKWPLPAELTSAEILRAFLGIPASGGTPTEQALNATLMSTDGARKIASAIQNMKLPAKADAISDYYSSGEDEGDDEDTPMAPTTTDDEADDPPPVQPATPPPSPPPVTPKLLFTIKFNNKPAAAVPATKPIQTAITKQSQKPTPTVVPTRRSTRTTAMASNANLRQALLEEKKPENWNG